LFISILNFRALQQIQKSIEQLQIEQMEIRQEMGQQKQQQIGPPSSNTGGQPSSQRQVTPPLQNSSLAVNQPTVGAVMMSASTLIRPNQTKQQPGTVHHNYSTDTYPSTKMSSRQTMATPIAAVTAIITPTPVQISQSSNAMAILANQPPQPPQRMPIMTKFVLPHQLQRQERPPNHHGGLFDNSKTAPASGHSSLEKKHSLAANSNAINYRKNSSHSLSVSI
jgi:hypothetical protein